MNTMKYILVLLVMSGLYACNDWLNVKPQTQQEREELYSSEDGFRSALMGCYMDLKQRDLYGKELTMNSIEYIAQLWRPEAEDKRDLAGFKWTTQTSKDLLKKWYAQLYKTVAQANDLLAYLDKKGEVIESENRRKMIRGEALAIRAFCHFDILRLFGQLPENDTIIRNLPYQEQATNQPVPFYDFTTYAGKVIRDFSDAADLLKVSDPVMHCSFDMLNDPDKALSEDFISDEFDAFRRMHFNYWAVKALLARVYLYIGDKDQAYSCAKEVIDAKVNEQPVVWLSCREDGYAGYYLLPHEILSGLNVYDIDEYVSELFRTGMTVIYASEKETVIDNDIFQGKTSDLRKELIWKKVAGAGLIGDRWNVKKYWQSKEGEQSSSGLDADRRMVPLIRLAEVYLIAVETAPDLNEANRLFREFKESRNLEYMDQNRDQITVDLLAEYRKEFYGEGQMFFTYKRMGSKKMLWREQEIAEGDYVLPIPPTEIEY